MNLRDSIEVAIEGLAANKMRAALTMLGVIIGVGAVITMLAIAQGAKEQMMTRIQSMGTNVLMVMAGQAQTGTVRGGSGSMTTLTLDDCDAISKKCPSIVAAVPEVRQNAQVKYRNQNTNTTILGTLPQYPSVRDFKLQEGRFINDREVKGSQRVAVIGPTPAEDLFGVSSPVGKAISIKGNRFKIVGMTATKGGFGDPDDQIFIPVTTAMRRVFGVQNIRTISVQAKSMALMDQATEEITQLLRKRHKLPDDGTMDDFRIINQAEFMQMAEDSSRTFTMLLAGIACVSLWSAASGL